MAFDWTDERISALSTPDLKNLRENATRKDVAALVEQCTAELEKRNANKPRKIGQPRSEAKQFEHDMSEQLAVVGKAMAEKYDLSEATAKAKSEGVKGFKAHKLLDAKGYAKLGGHQRNAAVAIDRYISYRLRNSIASLGVWLNKDAPVDAHEFHVSAPSDMLEGGAAFAEVRPGLPETELQTGHAIRAFKDLDGAAAAFDAALAKLTA